VRCQGRTGDAPLIFNDKKHMTRVLHSLLIGAPLLLGAVACAASEIQLESGATLDVTDTEYSRILPHAFYDQAIESLPHLFPSHVLLAGRRTGVLREVVYALIFYQETPSSKRVVIQAVAVHKNRAWSLNAILPTLYRDTLMQVIEQIGKLPTNIMSSRHGDKNR
jgi:hypothetical protein